MNEYKVDKSMLEQNSTEEIQHILKHYRDDYTPEAIALFQQIVRERGVGVEERPSAVALNPSKHVSAVDSSGGTPEVTNAADAIRLLNSLLHDTLMGSVEPATATAAAQIVMAILRAREMELLQENDD